MARKNSIHRYPLGCFSQIQKSASLAQRSDHSTLVRIVGFTLDHHRRDVLDQVFALDAQPHGNGRSHEHRGVNAKQNANGQGQRKVVQRRAAVAQEPEAVAEGPVGLRPIVAAAGAMDLADRLVALPRAALPALRSVRGHRRAP